MKMTYVSDGISSTLIIRSCLLQLLKHARVANAAVAAAPGATVTTTGALFIKTTLHGDAAIMFKARAAARREEFR